MTLDCIVRKYKPEDREAVRSICYHTGVMGDSLEGHFEDQELFADVMTSYYTDKEPESCWVVEDRKKGEVVGYLTGSVNNGKATRHQVLAALKKIPQTLAKLTFGRYQKGTAGFLKGAVKSALDVKGLPLKGGHTHTNILLGYRGEGYGIQLKEAFFEHAREKGVTHIYGQVIDLGHPKKMEYYRKLGYTEASRDPIKIFGKEGDVVLVRKELK